MSPRVKDHQEPNQHISPKEIKKVASENGTGSRPGVILGGSAPVLPGWACRGHMAPGPVQPLNPERIKLVTRIPGPRSPGRLPTLEPRLGSQPLQEAQPRPHSPSSYHSEAGEAPATSPFRAQGGKGGPAACRSRSFRPSGWASQGTASWAARRRQ